MSHQQKKRRLDDDVQSNDAHQVTFDALSTDVLARIFEYLSPEKIMLARLNKKMRDAATKTVVPMDRDIDNAFHVDSVRKYNALVAMVTALPNLQQIKIGSLGEYGSPNEAKYNDGEDPNNGIAICTANLATHDIGVLSNFTRLRELKIQDAPLNGRYPMLFNFPLLQKLHIVNMYELKFDPEMLVGLPFLEELIYQFGMMTGNIRSLRVLKDTLSKIDIRSMSSEHAVRGNFMDLADFPKLKCLTLTHCGVADFEEMSKDAFPALETLELYNEHVRGNFMKLSHLSHLKVLKLIRTSVTGDIRNIGTDDFPSLESLHLPPGVYGGCGFQFQRISDAPDVIAAVSTLLKQRTNLPLKYWYARLSDDSPDSYDAADTRILDEQPFPPLRIEFVKAGPRLGWRWIGDRDLKHPCEINWVDPEPSKECDDYETYIQELEGIEKNLYAYKGFYQPPTEEEYNRIYYEHLSRYLQP